MRWEDFVAFGHLLSRKQLQEVSLGYIAIPILVQHVEYKVVHLLLREEAESDEDGDELREGAPVVILRGVALLTLKENSFAHAPSDL